MNKFILKKNKHPKVCYLLRTDYVQVFHGSEEGCRKYVDKAKGKIIKIYH